ncbi:TPA: FAD synthase [Candidatus Peribacteria bacterium]|nr:MAG: hypothetical protein A3J91_03870 [Candidatus Peribacteria bacterium RIFOXYC2_FULL_58_10]OGJ84409.1 MAG: hypothetical protein A2529_03395 [Candidatus Peribacteria bacterium RIFOXYD2_FULL_58_15]HAI97974.1 FAD synthase [Candidatus Peribacteria bacterium]HAS34660.1 FAD synthase [Candidatus Peribacteria bacterium]
MRPRVLVFGTFDDLHPGHRFFLSEAGKRGELWIVVAHDETVRMIKGRPPLEPAKRRARSVSAAFPDAHVILGETEDYLAPVRQVHPDLILLGYDQALPPGVAIEALSCTVERLPAFEPHRHKSSVRRASLE